MACFIIIVRRHYYGPSTGPWELCTDESGEMESFPTREEAAECIEGIGVASLSRSEYARDYKILEATIPFDAIHVERRVSNSRPR